MDEEVGYAITEKGMLLAAAVTELFANGWSYDDIEEVFGVDKEGIQVLIYLAGAAEDSQA